MYPSLCLPDSRRTACRVRRRGTCSGGATIATSSRPTCGSRPVLRNSANSSGASSCTKKDALTCSHLSIHKQSLTCCRRPGMPAALLAHLSAVAPPDGARQVVQIWPHMMRLLVHLMPMRWSSCAADRSYMLVLCLLPWITAVVLLRNVGVSSAVERREACHPRCGPRAAPPARRAAAARLQARRTGADV